MTHDQREWHAGSTLLRPRADDVWRASAEVARVARCAAGRARSAAGCELSALVPAHAPRGSSLNREHSDFRSRSETSARLKSTHAARRARTYCPQSARDTLLPPRTVRAPYRCVPHFMTPVYDCVRPFAISAPADPRARHPWVAVRVPRKSLPARRTASTRAARAQRQRKLSVLVCASSTASRAAVLARGSARRSRAHGMRKPARARPRLDQRERGCECAKPKCVRWC